MAARYALWAHEPAPTFPKKGPRGVGAAPTQARPCGGPLTHWPLPLAAARSALATAQSPSASPSPDPSPSSPDSSCACERPPQTRTWYPCRWSYQEQGRYASAFGVAAVLVPALPALPALPAVPAVPALPALPAVVASSGHSSSLVRQSTHTVDAGALPLQ
jgi:hypothetical protein